MITETVLSRSLRMIFATGAVAGLSVFALPAMAQTEPAMQRVEITGSSIKRIAAEGSLPVQTLTRQQIEQSGVSNVADLVAALPAMQGFITSSASVNGGGTGNQTASVHAIGTDYTLVLLNGRRMAPFGTGSAVNLASIPLSAVERVEILTDGASTLYGSDAIAGVVNFILKKNQTDLNIEATYQQPQKKGGKSSNFAISKGFGNLDTDGYNVLLAYSHDVQKQLNANQRDFAKSGVRAFDEGGKKYGIFQTSINSHPANVEVASATFDEVLSADLATTGKCNAANTFSRGGVCRFDYASTVQLLPELKRDSVFASGNLKLNDTTSLFAELVLTKFSNQARYAPAAQPLTIFTGDYVNQNYIGAYNKSIVPLLQSAVGVNPAEVTDAFLYYRGQDAGGREDKYSTDAAHFVLGGESKVAGWDVRGAYTHSQNKQKDQAMGGYLSGDKFEALVKSGAYNPFILQANAREALKPAVLNNVFLVTESKIDVVNAGASKEVFDLPGGKAALGVGVDFTKQSFTDSPDEIVQGPGPQHPSWTDVVIGGSTGSQALDAARSSWGSFAELLMPVTKTLEATAAVRYDSYGKVEKKNVSYDPAGKASPVGDVGNDMSKATYKLSARWTPVSQVLVRGSYGTGFKAPTMNDIADPLKNFGSSNFFPCPPLPAGDARLALCKAGSSEYNLLTDGNPATGSAGLKPETSKQATFGFRVEPMASLSFGMDWWSVKLKDQVQAPSQQQIFTKAGLANQFLVSYYDPIQKSNVLAAKLVPVNLANSNYEGIDWDTTFRMNKTALGNFSANWTGTYMLTAERNSGEGMESSVGRFDSYSDVTFRLISRLVLSLRSSEKMMNSLTVSYRSGYHDQPITADDSAVRSRNDDGTFGGAVGLIRDVKAYTTLDYQMKYQPIKALTLTAGIKNLLDQDPPLSIRNAGGGNQVGYDGRYADPLGRTFYLTAGYKF